MLHSVCGVKIMGGRGTSTDRGSSKFGGGSGTATTRSIAGGGGVEGYGTKEQALARKIFGKNVSAKEIATMAGADAFAGARVLVKMKDGQLQVDVKHKFISTKRDEGMTRRFYTDAKGRLVIYNDQFYLTKAAQGRGVGLESFSTQVAAAKANKVSHIKTFALRNDSVKRPSIGYKVWADMGYNGILSARVQHQWTKANPFAKLDGVSTPRTVRELYATKGGRALWHRHGESQDMIFDLKRGSQSLKALNAYRKGKKKASI